MVGAGGAMVWLVRVAIEYIMINYALTCERGPALQGAVLTMGTLESGVYKNLGLWSMFWKEETLFLIHGEARCQDCQAIKQLLAVASTRKVPTQLRSWQRDHNNKINMSYFHRVASWWVLKGSYLHHYSLRLKCKSIFSSRSSPSNNCGVVLMVLILASLLTLQHFSSPDLQPHDLTSSGFPPQQKM